MGAAGSDKFRKKDLASTVGVVPLSYLCSEPCLAVGKTLGVNVNKLAGNRHIMYGFPVLHILFI